MKPTNKSVLKINKNDLVVSLKLYKDSAKKDFKIINCVLLKIKTIAKLAKLKKSENKLLIASILSSLYKFAISTVFD